MKRLWLCLPLVAACSKDTNQVVNSGFSSDTGPYVDEDAPVITHVPIETSQSFQQPVTIEATVVDDYAGVDKVEVSYKREDKATWTVIPLNLQDQASGKYSSQIPGPEVISGGMDYYLHAVDKAGNEVFLPTEGESNPYHFRIDGG